MAPTDFRHDPPLSEADIQAYADGILTPERSAYLRDYLGKDPAEARRVAFYGRLNAQIQQAFQESPEPAASPAAGSAGERMAALDGSSGSLRRPSRGNPQRRLHWPPHWLSAPHHSARAARFVLSVVLACVAVSGWFAATQVSAQALNNAAVMALAETANAGWSTAAPTRASDASPDLSSVGLRLVAERSMSLGLVQRVRQAVYLNADGRPVVVLSALALVAPAQPQWAARRIGDIRLLTWTAQRQRYVVAGDALTHGLMRAADALTMH